MQTRQLGRSGIEITALGLGTNYVGGHNLYTDVDEDEGVRLVQCAIDNGISFIPWGPLAYGLLGGRYERDFKLPDGDWRARSGAFDDAVYANNLDVVDGLKIIAAAKSVPVAHVALQWLLSRPAVSSVICGAKQSAQVLQNIACDAVSLSTDELASIDALLASTSEMPR